ncbi:hypothetical protein VTJ04DRAFT_3506 [Mycothermus thermophilus]|uniref:uncharacterized protein n=1 Tax=Humicola insolens TaxID=85995 RepID=UPI00374437AC
MHPQDELAALFSRNLSLHPVPPPAPEPTPAPAPAATSTTQPQGERKIVYISAHYHHSAHLANRANDPQPPQRPASEPPQDGRSAVERVLREHGVDPSNLTTAQIQLVKSLDRPFQERLIEIWRACPPPPPNITADSTTPTTFEQEEALARLRFEQQQQELIDQQLQQEFSCSGATDSMMQDEPETVLSLDGTPLTPVQASDGSWVGATGNGPGSPAYYYQSNAYSYMEPYMAAGYEEELMRREYLEQRKLKEEEQLRLERLARGNVDDDMTPRSAEAETSAVPHLQGTANTRADSAARDGGLLSFNPAHADPVYKAMENQYGRFTAMRDVEMY